MRKQNWGECVFKPKWNEMLPASVKPIQNEKIKNLDSFRKKLNFSDEMFFMAIMVSKWAVIKIQKYTLEIFGQQFPNLNKKELWKSVVVSRLQTKLNSLFVGETGPFAKPLSREEILSLIENLDKTISNFKISRK